MSTQENNIATEVQTLTPAQKRKATREANKAKKAEQSTENNVEKIEENPKESAPKISKFDKITNEFCSQNEVSKEQLLGYLLKKSVGKKTNLNQLAEDLMKDSFFNKEKMLTEIKG